MNLNPKMKGASKNISQIFNPKPIKEKKHKVIEKELIKEIFG